MELRETREEREAPETVVRTPSVTRFACDTSPASAGEEARRHPSTASENCAGRVRVADV